MAWMLKISLPDDHFLRVMMLNNKGRYVLIHGIQSLLCVVIEDAIVSNTVQM